MKISIILPNYNHERYLRERIESILNQSYQNFELIILDDLSSDNSRDIINTYKNHPKVSHVLFNKENSGSTFKQWNKGIDLAEGDWIWIAESDDLAEVDLLDNLVKGIECYPKTVLAYCQSSRINSEGKITGSWKDWTKNLPLDFNKNFNYEGKTFITSALIDRNVIPNASAVLFRKDIYYEVKKVDQDIRYNADWLLWLKILLKGDVFFCAKELNNFRYHSESVIAKSAKENNIPFKKKYDILMIKKFLMYLNVFKQYDLKPLFENKILHDSIHEYQFLMNQKFRKAALPYFIDQITYSNNKLKTLLRSLSILKKSLCSQ